jgi:hypothetical protein
MRAQNKDGTQFLVIGSVRPRQVSGATRGTFPHKVIVELVSRNKSARRIFNLMDDVFYGRKPKPKAPPAWTELKE